LKAVAKSSQTPLAKYTMAVTVMMTGIPAHRIRKYEEAGICKPARTSSQQRLYSDDDIKLIQKISLLEGDGVNLAGIKIILEMQNQQAASPPQRQSANLETQLTA
jgi:MerR family transcriptional regulator/heat shock protein HspR